MKKYLLLILLLSLLISLTGQATAGGHFIVALETDVVQFDPLQIQDATTSNVAFQMMERLLYNDPRGEYIPGLATNWWSNETGDVWTFELRQGVVFHDGSPFNADVANWHFQRARTEGNYATQFTVVDRIETPDEYTIVFYLNEPSAAFIENTVMSNAGFIPSRKNYEEMGDQFPYEPVGTGPFVWHNWEVGQRVELLRNENWWGDVPKIESLTYRVIPEASTQIIELETGGVHLITRAPEADLMRLLDDPDFNVIVEPAYRSRFFEFNLEKEPFEDIRVRKAINYAIDMERIVTALGQPLVVYADSLVPMASWAYNESLTTFGYDPEKAKALLEEAGYTLNNQGKLERDGNLLEITIHSPDGRYFMDKEMAQAVANQLTGLGITVRIQVMEWGAFIDDIFGSAFQMTYLGWNQSSPEPSIFTDPLTKTDGRANFGNRSHEELDSILEKAMITPGVEDRKDLYARAQEIINENAWHIFVGNEALTWITPIEIKDFHPSAASQYNFTTLFIEK